MLPELEVERPQGLVEQQDSRPQNKCPRQGHPLALTTGQLRWSALLQAGHPNEIEHLGYPLAALPLFHFADHQTIGDVVPDAHVREEGIVLENGVHLAFKRRLPGHVATVEQDPTGGGLIEAGQQPQASRLARARRPEKSEELSVEDVKAEVIDGFYVTEMPTDVIKPDSERRRPTHQDWATMTCFVIW